MAEANRRSFLKSAVMAGAAISTAADVFIQAASAQGFDVDGNAGTRGNAEHFSSRMYDIEAGNLEMTIDADSGGISLTRIQNRSTGVSHLKSPTALFSLTTTACPSGCSSNHGFVVERVQQHDRHSVEIACRAAGLALSLSITGGQHSALLRLSFRNESSEAMAVRTTFPHIANLVTQSPNHPLMAAVPQESAGVISFDRGDANLGMPFDPVVGLPHAMNTMEVVSIFDPLDSSGVYFCDAGTDIDQGAAPLQFTLTGDTVAAYTLSTLAPHGTTTLPALEIGVHNTGDWHAAIDAYSKHHRPHWEFKAVPAWFRDEGAIYSFSGSGGGAIYMEYPQQDLKTRIDSFDDLPKLLVEAQSLGTNIVYLFDYWNGVKEGGRPIYWNKGDYIPRADLGGSAALARGIRAIHEKGGRIILYVEPFIVFEYSDLGKAKGAAWAGRREDGSLYDQYPQNFTMVPCFKPWHDYLVATAVRLVRDFSADGIFLDSWGWQLNWPIKTEQEGRLYSPLEYSNGVIALANDVRQAIREVKPDAIVMGESTSGGLGRCWDGGLSADFAWLRKQNQGKVLGSPIRYAMPEMNVFTNGRNLAEMNQVFAAGHNLALLNANLPEADYIRKLVGIRQRYKNALIYGRQEYQPVTGEKSMVAYYYKGDQDEIVTAVNVSEKPCAGTLALRSQTAPAEWRDLLNGSSCASGRSGDLPLDIPPGGLRVLLREQR